MKRPGSSGHIEPAIKKLPTPLEDKTETSEVGNCNIRLVVYDSLCFYNSNSLLRACLLMEKASKFNRIIKSTKLLLCSKSLSSLKHVPDARETDRAQIWPQSMSSVRTNASWKPMQKHRALMNPASQGVGRSRRAEQCFFCTIKTFGYGEMDQKLFGMLQMWEHFEFQSEDLRSSKCASDVSELSGIQHCVRRRVSLVFQCFPDTLILVFCHYSP